MPLTAQLVVECEDCGTTETVDMEYGYSSYSADSGEPNMEFTIEALSRNWGWVVVKKHGEDYIVKCESCTTFTICDECEAQISKDNESTINRDHEEYCSLYPEEVEA